MLTKLQIFKTHTRGVVTNQGNTYWSSWYSHPYSGGWLCSGSKTRFDYSQVREEVCQKIDYRALAQAWRDITTRVNFLKVRQLIRERVHEPIKEELAGPSDEALRAASRRRGLSGNAFRID